MCRQLIQEKVDSNAGGGMGGPPPMGGGPPQQTPPPGNFLPQQVRINEFIVKTINFLARVLKI